MTFLRFFFGLALASTSLTSLTAQNRTLEFPAPSPAITVQQRIGLTDFELTYSRPSVKGRQIFDGILAYGELWRTGANATTKLTFNHDITFGGQAVPAGTYSLYSIPGRDSWTLMLNSKAEGWGVFHYEQLNDVATVTVPSRHDAPLRETLHIGFDALRDESAMLEIAWENTVVQVPITVDVRSRLQPRIEAAMASGEPLRDSTYYQAASFYYQHIIDLNKAAEWIDLALKQNPKAFWMLHLKGKIHVALGNTELAREALEASTTYAVETEGPHSGYKVMNDALLADL